MNLHFPLVEGSTKTPEVFHFEMSFESLDWQKLEVTINSFGHQNPALPEMSTWKSCHQDCAVETSRVLTPKELR